MTMYLEPDAGRDTNSNLSSSRTSVEFDSISVDTRGHLTSSGHATGSTGTFYTVPLPPATPEPYSTSELNIGWLSNISVITLNLKKDIARDAPGVFHAEFILSDMRRLQLSQQDNLQTDEESQSPPNVANGVQTPQKTQTLRDQTFHLRTMKGKILFTVKRKADGKSFEVFLQPNQSNQACKLCEFIIPNPRCPNVSIQSYLIHDVFRANLSKRNNMTIKGSDGNELGAIVGLGKEFETINGKLYSKCSLKFVDNPERGLSIEEKLIMTALLVCFSINYKAEVKDTTFLCRFCFGVLMIAHILLFVLLSLLGFFRDTSWLLFGVYYGGFILVYFIIAVLFSWFMS